MQLDRVVPFALLVAVLTATSRGAPDSSMAPARGAGVMADRSRGVRSNTLAQGSPTTIGTPRATASDTSGSPDRDATLLDEVNGLVFTYRVATNVIEVSDGRAIQLPSELWGPVLAEFHGARVADSLALDLEGAVASGFVGCDVGDPDNPCDQVRGFDRRARREVRFTWRIVGPRGHQRAWKDAPGLKETETGKTSLGTMSVPQGGFTCTDIADAAIPRIVEYRTRRSGGGYVRALLAAILGEFGNAALNYTSVPAQPSQCFLETSLRTTRMRGSRWPCLEVCGIRMIVASGA